MGLFGTYTERVTESKDFISCILVLERFVSRAYLREDISLFYFAILNLWTTSRRYVPHSLSYLR